MVFAGLCVATGAWGGVFWPGTIDLVPAAGSPEGTTDLTPLAESRGRFCSEVAGRVSPDCLAAPGGLADVVCLGTTIRCAVASADRLLFSKMPKGTAIAI